ncbi:fibronectin type III domain-containing protein 9 [Conger conger]|uniref:fibronectin type III domain-containing protein 9 n=1 Tax=Conger conger TaxID=82655 RepID=UPI002A5A9C10|nr:fibronectin type III domain-containing protein 9 [Conger conger]
MPLTVQNVTATSATVAWSPIPGGCRGGFYSVMYHPNWNSLLTGHAHRNFLREAAVPAGQTSTSLGELSPHTAYVLCVTCRAAVPANPSRDRCQVFNTLQEPEPGGRAWGGAGGELAMGVWLASTVLLVIIAAVLLYGCLQAWWQWDRDWTGNGNAKGGRGPSPGNSTGGDPQPDSFTGNPSHTTPPPHICAPEQVPLSAHPDREEPCATP